MELTVMKTVGTQRGLEVWFREHIIASEGTLNEKGLLAWRILRRLAPGAMVINPSHDDFGHCLLVEGAKGIEGFETPVSAQDVLKHFVHLKQRVSFLQCSVVASDHKLENQTKLSTVEEAYLALKQGKFVFVEFVIQFSLPIHPVDTQRIHSVLPGHNAQLHLHKATPNGILVRILLSGELLQQDPWKLMEYFQGCIVYLFQPED